MVGPGRACAIAGGTLDGGSAASQCGIANTVFNGACLPGYAEGLASAGHYIGQDSLRHTGSSPFGRVSQRPRGSLPAYANGNARRAERGGSAFPPEQTRRDKGAS